jgi:hypothetical protein
MLLSADNPTMTDEGRTSTGVRKVAVKTMVPQTIVKVVFVGVNYV